MRLLLFMLGICVGILCIGNRAEAQNYPWCGVYRDGVMICSFTTFQQCLATVSQAGFCIQNSTYQTLPGPRPSTSVQKRYPY
jgi:hypothetical protein